MWVNLSQKSSETLKNKKGKTDFIKHCRKKCPFQGLKTELRIKSSRQAIKRIRNLLEGRDSLRIV